MSSWFSRNVLLEKLILYFIDKSPLNIDPKNLNVSNGQFKFKDVNLNANKVANGSIASMEIQISNGLRINADGTDLIVNSASSDDSSSPNDETPDSFTVTKSVMDLANSVMVSIDEVSKQEAMNEEDLQSTDSDDDEYALPKSPPKSVIESMRNKIIEMALSNLQIHLTNTRLLFIDRDLIVHVDSIQLETAGKQRVLTISGVYLVEEPPKTNAEDSGSDDEMMGSSIYMSAMSNIKTEKSTVQEKRAQILESITVTFAGITDIQDLIPKSIRVSGFVLNYSGMKISVSPFLIVLNRTISRTLYSVDRLNFEFLQPNSSPIYCTVRGIVAEVFSKVIHNFYNNIGIASVHLSHLHFSGHIKLKGQKNALTITLKPQSKTEIKLKGLEIVLKSYRINTGLILKIPAVSMSHCKGVVKGIVRSCGLGLIEEFDNPKAQSTVGMLKGVDFKYENKKLNLAISDVLGSFCCDSFHSFVQTCMDVTYSVTFPHEQKYKTKVDKNLDLTAILGADYFTPEKTAFTSKADATKKGSASSKKFKLIKSYLDDKQANKPQHQADKAAVGLPSIEVNLSISNIHLQLYDGYEWEYTRHSINDALRKQVNQNEVLFGSIYVERPANNEDRSESIYKSVNEVIHSEFQASSVLDLQKTCDYKGLVKISHLKLNFVNYKTDLPSEDESRGSGEMLNKMSMTAMTLEIFDNVPTSNWNKFLTSLKTTSSEHLFNRNETPMVTLALENVKPTDFLLATELRMYFKLCDLKLHIHEDMLDFMARFFSFRDPRFELVDEYPDIIFLQKFEVEAVRVNLDFKATKSTVKNFRSKLFNELKTMVVVENSELLLKHVVAYGMDGFGALGQYLQSVWLADIISSQRLSVLNGVAPVRTLVALGSGVRALVQVPMREYPEQGLLRSVQKGLTIFGKTTSTELLRLGVNITTGTQSMLENTETALKGNMHAGDTDYLGGMQESGQKYIEEEIQRSTPDLFQGSRPVVPPQTPSAPHSQSLYSDQPSNAHEGLTRAYDSVNKNWALAYELAKNTRKEVSHAETKKEAALFVAKTAPVALLRPFIGATEALSKTLQGLNNEISNSSTHKQQIEDKYKHAISKDL